MMEFVVVIITGVSRDGAYGYSPISSVFPNVGSALQPDDESFMKSTYSYNKSSPVTTT